MYVWRGERRKCSSVSGRIGGRADTCRCALQIKSNRTLPASPGLTLKFCNPRGRGGVGGARGGGRRGGDGPPSRHGCRFRPRKATGWWASCIGSGGQGGGFCQHSTALWLAPANSTRLPTRCPSLVELPALGSAGSGALQPPFLTPPPSLSTCAMPSTGCEWPGWRLPYSIESTTKRILHCVHEWQVAE